MAPIIILLIVTFHQTWRVSAAVSLPWWTTIRNVQLVYRAGDSGMLTFPFSLLLPRMLPRRSLQFHSTSFNFLTGRDAQGQEVHLPLHRCPLPSSPLPLFFISVRKTARVWISYFRLARTRLCQNNPSSPPGAETLAGS